MFRFKFLFLKIVLTLFFFGFSIFFIWQIYLNFKFRFATEIVYSTDVKKKLDVSGIFFKDENLLDYGNGGNIIKNLYNDGERVSGKSAVAKKYFSESDVQNIEKIKKLDEKIESLYKIQKLGGGVQNFGSLNKQIFDNYFEFLHCLKKGTGSSVYKIKNKIVDVLNQKQILMNKVRGFDESIKHLKKERDLKFKLISSNCQTVYTPVSGYFVGSTDGFENTCSLSGIDEFDYDKLKTLFDSISSKVSTEKLGGKIIVEPKILFKAWLPKHFSIDFKVGDQCLIKFEQLGEEVAAELVDLNLSTNEKNSIATFQIRCVNGKLASLRKSKAQVSFKKYNGLKVNKMAVRINDENKVGVYVLVGSSVKFKLIDIISEFDDFVISKIHEENRDYLKELDEVLVRGKNLHDKKRIK